MYAVENSKEFKEIPYSVHYDMVENRQTTASFEAQVANMKKKDAPKSVFHKYARMGTLPPTLKPRPAPHTDASTNSAILAKGDIHLSKKYARRGT